MLLVFSGSDRKQKNTVLKKVLEELKVKREGAEVATLQPVEDTLESFIELLSTSGLFETKRIILLPEVLKQAEWRAFVDKEVNLLTESEHAVLISDDASENSLIFDERRRVGEAKTRAGTLKKLEEAALKVYRFEKREIKLSAFTLSDAVVKKDKKNAWKIFQELMEKGATPEALHGTLWWQFKTLCLVSGSPSAKDAGVAPYAYTKAKKALEVWSKEEVHEVIMKLVAMVHGEERGSLSEQLELFLLQV